MTDSMGMESHMPVSQEAAATHVAEFVGTFMLVFTAGACSVAGEPLWSATAVACMMMVMVYAFGPISGGHLNPAVSVACGLVGKVPWSQVMSYVFTQVAAGLLAGLAYSEVFGEATAIGPKASFGWFHVGIAELVYTAMLCFVVLNCRYSSRNNPQLDQNHFFALAIGFVLVAGGYAARDVSGACFNPAVTVGLDVRGLWRTKEGTAGGSRLWWLAYVAYQLLGAGLAALLFHGCRGRELPDLGVEAGDTGRRTLTLRVLAAYNLRNRDSGIAGDLSDPYVVGRVGLTEHRTLTVNNSLNPVWGYDNTFTFSLSGGSAVLTVEVMNANSLLPDQSLGMATVDLRDLPVDRWLRRREWLMGGQNSELEFELCLGEAGGVGLEPSLPSRLLSEFLGTFMLVLTVGLNAVTKSAVVPWSAAAALMSMIYSLGGVSGGHFNPAVTLGVVLSRRGLCPPARGSWYTIAQLLAGVLAGLLCADFHVAGPYRSESFGPGPGALPGEAGGVYSWRAVFVAELAFTAMLVFVVLAVATVTPPFAETDQSFQFALAIGSCVTAGGFAIGNISGGELNPAVAFGLAATSAASNWGTTPPWHCCLLFSAFQLAGGVAAASLFRLTHFREYKTRELAIGSSELL